MATESILGGISTEETQTEIKELTAALYEVCERLAFLAASKGIAADLRTTVINTIAATISSGTVTTVSTVSTVGSVTNQVSNGGFATNPQIPSLMNLAAENNIKNINLS